MWRLVTVRPAAERDVAKARAWYEAQRPGLGDPFLRSIADALTHLEEGAELSPPYYENFRRVLTKRFPYKLFYRIEGDAVIVFRVLHSAEDHTKRLK